MNTYSEMLLGMLAVDLGFVTPQQIEGFFTERNSQPIDADPPPPINDHLQSSGLLNAGQITALASLQQQLETSDEDIILGRMMVAQRLVTVTQVFQALRHQKTLPERVSIGDIFKAGGLIDDGQLAGVLQQAQLVRAANQAGAAAPAAEPAADPTPEPEPETEPETEPGSETETGEDDVPDTDAAGAPELEVVEKTLTWMLFGMLAVDQGFLTPGELEECWAAKADEQSLSDLMVECGFLESPQVDALQKLQEKLEETDEDVLFARLATEEGLVTVAQTEWAMNEQKALEELIPIGDIMVEVGVMSADDNYRLTAETSKRLHGAPVPQNFDDLLFGMLAVDQGFCTTAQLEEAKEQRDPEEPLWVHLLNEGYLTENRLNSLTKLKSRLEEKDEDIVFATILVDCNLGTVAQVEDAFKEQKSRTTMISLADLLLQNSNVSIKQKRQIEQEVKRRIEGTETPDPLQQSGSSTATPVGPAPTPPAPQVMGPGSAPAPAPAAAAPPARKRGKRFGPYEIMREISRGGMGIIYQAHNVEKDREVALKTLAPHLAINQEFVERFNREAQALAKLSHPNIVGVHSIGHAGKIHFMEMEFIDGEDIRALCEREGPIAVDRAVKLLIPIVAALDHAWGRHIIHRDVKPENIMITKQGVPKLTDFGIAKLLENDSATRTGDFFGSPYYTAPEQLKHAKSIDFRADIYSLGACFFRMLTGQPPFSGENAFQVIAAVLHEPIPKRKQLEVDIGKETYRAFEFLMAKAPKDRPRSAKEVVQLLRSLIQQVNCPHCNHAMAVFVSVCPGCGRSNNISTGQFMAVRPGDRPGRGSGVRQPSGRGRQTRAASEREQRIADKRASRRRGRGRRR